MIFQTLFHLGKHPELSDIEIRERFPHFDIIGRKGSLLMVDGHLQECPKIQAILGGTTAISHILYRGTCLEQEEIIALLTTWISDHANNEHRVKIGISANIPRFPSFYVGLNIKKELIKENFSVRLVGKKGEQINGVHVLKEDLIPPHGYHFWLFFFDKELIISLTQSVQDIDAYGERDFGKPARDAKVGMMPPKLTQIMINLAHPAQKILDPFCGTGTTLLEAMIQGKQCDGSDRSRRMVEMTEENIHWFLEKYPHCPVGKVQVLDACNLFQWNTPYQAIVTEGYLGPVYSELPSLGEQEENFRTLAGMYKDVFRYAKKILLMDGRVVITFPVYHSSRGNNRFFTFFRKRLDEMGWRVVLPPILYGRADQIVWREIVVLQTQK